MVTVTNLLVILDYVDSLWRLGRLGSQGWIVFGLWIREGCGRQCDCTMFLGCLLPSAGAFNLYVQAKYLKKF